MPDAALQEAFEKFYLSKHQGRRLAWQNSLGHATVKAQFGEGKHKREHMLQVSLYQGAILLLFNQSNELSYQEIKDAVGIEEKDLRVTLQVQACPSSLVPLSANCSMRDALLARLPRSRTECCQA